MDPNACLAEMIEISNDLIDKEKNSSADDPIADPVDAIRLAELILALDTWIVNGGFLPTDWSK